MSVNSIVIAHWDELPPAPSGLGKVDGVLVAPRMVGILASQGACGRGAAQF
jgi:hypothetical protein